MSERVAFLEPTRPLGTRATVQYSQYNRKIAVEEIKSYSTILPGSLGTTDT